MDPITEEKQTICEEMCLQDGWYRKALEINSMAEMENFIMGLITEFKHDFGTACHVLVTSLLATAQIVMRELSILNGVEEKSGPEGIRRALEAKTMAANIFSQFF